jgi:hypothetical protein
VASDGPFAPAGCACHDSQSHHDYE